MQTIGLLAVAALFGYALGYGAGHGRWSEVQQAISLVPLAAIATIGLFLG